MPWIKFGSIFIAFPTVPSLLDDAAIGDKIVDLHNPNARIRDKVKPYLQRRDKIRKACAALPKFAESRQNYLEVLGKHLEAEHVDDPWEMRCVCGCAFDPCI